MAIEIYQGKYINAEDASNLVDIPTIQAGCNKIKDASDQLERLTKRIELLNDVCTREAISIKGNSLEKIIAEYATTTQKFSKYLNDLVDNINNTSQRVINRQQVLLNEKAKGLDAKITALHESREEREEQRSTNPVLFGVSEDSESDDEGNN